VKTIHLGKLSLSLLLAHPVFGDVSPIVIAPPPCPKTFAEWVDFRSDFVNRYAITSSKGSDTVGLWAQGKLKYIAGCRKNSLDVFTKNPGLDQCFAPVTHWLTALTPFQSSFTTTLSGPEKDKGPTDPPPQKLGMNVPDAEYYKRTSQFTSIPADLRDNQDFLSALNKPKNSPAVYAELEKINAARKQAGKPQLEWAQFKGNVKAAGSGTLVRLMVYEPGNPAKWFSIGLPADDGTRTPQWSAIAVHEKNGVKNTYFKDHWRQYTRDPKAADDSKDAHYSTSFEDVQEGKFSDACWKCHKSGLLALPIDPSLPEADRKKTARFNQLMEQTGRTGSAGFYDPATLGPGLGGDPTTEAGLNELREVLFPYCVADAIKDDRSADRKAVYDKMWNAIDKRKVLEAMNCSACHDGNQRGKLTVPFGDILFRYVDEGRMPTHANLNETERSVLKACLNLEYSGVTNSDESYRLYKEGRDGGISRDAESDPKPWYERIVGLPNVKGTIQGRLARHLLNEPCTSQGKSTKEPKASTDRGTHGQGTP